MSSWFLSGVDVRCSFQTLPSHLTPRLLRMSKTPVWTHLPISPSGPLRSPWAGQHGLLCHRVKNRLRRWVDPWTPSSLLSVTPPLVAALTCRMTLPPPGPSPRRVPHVSPQKWTTHQCSSLLSLRRSPRLRWSRRCGTVNTSPPRTPSSLRLRGLSPRTP